MEGLAYLGAWTVIHNTGEKLEQAHGRGKEVDVMGVCRNCLTVSVFLEKQEAGSTPKWKEEGAAAATVTGCKWVEQCWP